MARTIAQIVKTAREQGAHNLTPAEFRVLKGLEKAKKEDAAKEAAATADPTQEASSSAPGKSKGNKGWYTRQEMADFFGFTIVQFDRAVRPDMEPTDIKRVNSKLLFRGRGAIDAYTEKFKIKKVDGDDDMYSDADSPALERYRSIKADLAQIDLDERRRTTIKLDDAKETMAILAAAIRSLGDRMQRKYGRDVGLMFDEALDEAEITVRARFGGAQPTSNPAAVADATASATMAQDASAPRPVPGMAQPPGGERGPATIP